MAEFETMRSTAAGRVGEIDEGLRTHMNKVYGTMSVGMLIQHWPHGPLPVWQPRLIPPWRLARWPMARCSRLSALPFTHRLYAGL